MAKKVYRYQFSGKVRPRELEESLLLAVVALECLHGQSCVRLDTRYYMQAKQRACVIDASSRVGRDLNRVFIGLVSREFGQNSFRVRRMCAPIRRPGGTGMRSKRRSRARSGARRCQGRRSGHER